MEKKFVANKALIVNPEGKILLLQDSGASDHTNMKGKWDVPGGRMNAKETPAQALEREVMEEAGIEIDPLKAKPFHIDIWGVQGDIENEPIIGIFYVIEVDAIRVALSNEHSKFMWFDPKDEINFEIKESVKRAIYAYKRAL